MTPVLAMELVRQAMTLTLLVAAPLLAVILLVGLVISLLQAVTSIQEQTLTFVPKLLAVAAVLVVMMPWMLRQLIEYLTRMIRLFPQLVG